MRTPRPRLDSAAKIAYKKYNPFAHGFHSGHVACTASPFAADRKPPASREPAPSFGAGVSSVLGCPFLAGNPARPATAFL